MSGVWLQEDETGITVTYQDADGTLDFVVASQTDENFTTADHAKLDGIEANADVTDTTNVTAGALMDSELTDLAGVKGVTISTLQPKPSEGAFANGDKTKLDGINATAIRQMKKYRYCWSYAYREYRDRHYCYLPRC